MFDAPTPAPTPAFAHVFIPAELFGVLQSYLGAGPVRFKGAFHPVFKRRSRGT